jgi:hypothetical protein
MQFFVLFQKWGREKFPFSILRYKEQGIKTTLEKYKIWKKKGARKGVGEEFVKQHLFAESKTGRKQKQRDKRGNT